MNPDPIKVLIVDDSALVRQTLTAILSADPRITVIGAASNPFAAADHMQREAPDVITLDVEMPRMDGLTFLKKLMSQHPLPVVICSSMAGAGSETAVRALEYGAVEIISKPRLGTRLYLEESRTIICDAVKAAALAKVKRLPSPPAAAICPRVTADAILARPVRRPVMEPTDKVVVMGASTGGTEALQYLLQDLPPDAPGMVIVQHMPENFTAAFARRLDSVCPMAVKEAENGDDVLRGRVLIAPGNRHVLLKHIGGRYHVQVREGPLVNRHRPSIDVLFRSTARYAGDNAVGVIMTGHGGTTAHGA